MNKQPSPVGSATSGPAAFDERLSVPPWWYLPAAGLGVLLGAEIHMGYPGVRSWIGYVVLIPLFLAALWWLGRSRVQIRHGALTVGDSMVSLAHVGHTDVVAKSDRQQALGPDLDPMAVVLHRSWVGPVVRIEITDPAAEAPYWVVSSRRPAELVTALGGATSGGGPGQGPPRIMPRSRGRGTGHPRSSPGGSGGAPGSSSHR